MQRYNNIILSYFAGFGMNNITQISENFHHDIVLNDWIDTWTGRDHVEKAIRDLLNQVSIIIVPEKIFWSEDENSIVATCMIDIYAGNAHDKVVDIIEMTHEGIIKKVTAYKQ